MVVLDAGEGVLHLVQFVVVRGKHHLGATHGVVVEELGDGPSDADAVVSAGAAPDFVKQHKAPRRHIIQNARRLVHLHHKRRFARRDVVGGTHTGENLVHQPDTRRSRRNEATHLRHQHYQGGLAQQGRLTRHIRAGDDDDLLLVGVEVNIVGDVALAHGHHLLDDGMAAFLDVQDKRIVDDGLHIVVFQRNVGETHQAVNASHDGSIHLNGFHELRHGGNELIVNPLLDDTNFLLRAEDFLLVLLQFLSDVTLGVGQGLLADPLRRHLVLMRIGDFEIIAEHIVVAHFQGRNARAFRFAALDVHQVFLA